MNIKVFLVDDHPLLREGLRQAIARQPHLTVIGEASTGTTALKSVKELAPDLVVMDVHLPDISGTKIIRQLLDLFPAMKVVIFSADTNRSLVDEALQAGACGYIWKQSATEELIQAMEMVMAGKLYLSPEINAGILEDYRKSLAGEPDPAKPLISDRDKQLLRLIAEGCRNKEIAAQLAVSPKSVEAYRSRLMKKLGYSSSAELVRYAIRQGIVPA